jgi:hypothetical protein
MKDFISDIALRIRGGITSHNLTYQEIIDAITKEMLIQSLKAHPTVTAASHWLGVKRPAFYSMMERTGLKPLRAAKQKLKKEEDGEDPASIKGVKSDIISDYE